MVLFHHLALVEWLLNEVKLVFSDYYKMEAPLPYHYSSPPHCQPGIRTQTLPPSGLPKKDTDDPRDSRDVNVSLLWQNYTRFFRELGMEALEASLQMEIGENNDICDDNPGEYIRHV